MAGSTERLAAVQKQTGELVRAAVGEEAAMFAAAVAAAASTDTTSDEVAGAPKETHLRVVDDGVSVHAARAAVVAVAVTDTECKTAEARLLQGCATTAAEAVPPVLLSEAAAHASEPPSPLLYAKGQVVVYTGGAERRRATVVSVDYDGLNAEPFYTIEFADGVSPQRQTISEKLELLVEDEEQQEQLRDLMARRISRFIAYAAAVRARRVRGGASTRAFAMDGDAAAKATASKKKPRRPTVKNLKKGGRTSMYEGETLMAGSLEKLASGRRKRWQLRYFSLRGHYLKYFPDRHMAEVKGVVDMACVRGVIVEGNMITIDLDGAPMQLRADGAKEGEDGGEAMTPEEEAAKWGTLFQAFADKNLQGAEVGEQQLNIMHVVAEEAATVPDASVNT